MNENHYFWANYSKNLLNQRHYLIAVKKQVHNKSKQDILERFHFGNKFWIVLILVIITFITFSPSLKNDFVRYDDHLYITENQLIKDISINNLGKFKEIVVGNFHPVTMFSLALDYHLFGLNPFYYHLKNLIFHLLNTVLVFILILKISKNNLFVSFFTALLFGVHPMHVESVAWVSERKDVLYSFYFLVGLLLYYEYLDKKKITFYILTFLSFVLACLSKPAAVVLPLVLILIDYYETGNISFKQIKSKIPFLIVSIWIGIVAINTQTITGAIEIGNYNFWEKIQYSLFGLGIYFLKFFVPYNLVNWHPYPELSNNIAFTIISAFLLLGTIIFAIKYSKKVKWFFWGITFSLITIILVLQLLQVGNSFISDRYTYIPYIGIGFIYINLLGIAIKRYPKLKTFITLVLVSQVTLLASIAHGQVNVWKNTISLWENFMKHYPKYSPEAYNNIAEYYQAKGDIKNVLVTYNKALQENNKDLKTLIKRGRFYLGLQKDNLALKDFETAISIKNDYFDAVVGEGITLYRLGNFEAALKSFSRAIEINKNNFEVYNLRGNTYLKLNNKDKALEDINKALELNRNFTEALNTKAMILRLSE